ncbi:MAG: hypothetical protein OXF01_01350, partial [Gemmatimonadetes bacterium]|nr:hypothetical protein [Gemmatimonadota bacterium]
LAVHAFPDFDASGDGGRVSRTLGNSNTYEKWVRWTLGPAPGPQSLLVTVLHGSATAEIGAVALHPDSVVAVLLAHTGEGQGALPGEALAEPVVVAVLDTLGRRGPGASVRFEAAAGHRSAGSAGAAGGRLGGGGGGGRAGLDAGGRRIPGATVRFETAAGHGSADPAETASDSLGLAAAVWTLGEAPGRQTLVASAGAGASVEVGAVVQSDEGVCARTPAVADEIARLAGVAGCAEVTEAHLAELRARLSAPIMDLSRRGLRRLRSGDFAGLSLNWLDLSRNELTELPPGIFEGLATRAIHLEYNRLAELPPGIFEGLADLRILDLRHNRLAALPPGIFDGLARIRYLYLDNNRLAELPEGVFRDLTGIVSLWLTDNRLAELPEGVFDGLAELGDLRLNGNRLAELPPGIFDGLTGLERLWLGYQGRPMYALPPGIFDDLENLRVLDLGGLGLTELRPGVFGALKNLESLSLRFNHLSELRPGVFGGLGKLRSLSLQENELTELPPGIFAGLRSLEHVIAEGNPGSPFPVGVAFARLDAGLLAPGPAQLAMRVPDGAPFALRMPVSVQRGTASAEWLEVAAGDTLSAAMVVGRPAGSAGAVHLSFGQPPPVPEWYYRALEVVAGEQIALFAEPDNRTPEVAEPVPPYWVPAGSGAVALELAPHFRDPDGDSLVYGVETSDGRVAGGSIAGGVLWMEPRSEGEVVLEVTATDAGGLAASQRVALEVGPAPDPDRFNINLVFGSGFSERHREVARQAADRWEEIVVGDLSNVPLDGYLPPCGLNDGPGIAGDIDDVVILMNRVPDGPAHANSCATREASGLHFWSSTKYPPGYFAPDFERWDSFYTVVLHEIGHVLGIGSVKWLNMLRTLPNTEPPDEYFPGPLAIQAFNAAGGRTHDGGKVPVQDGRELGSSVHWRFRVFGREVMAGGSPLI